MMEEVTVDLFRTLSKKELQIKPLSERIEELTKEQDALLQRYMEKISEGRSDSSSIAMKKELIRQYDSLSKEKERLRARF